MVLDLKCMQDLRSVSPCAFHPYCVMQMEIGGDNKESLIFISNAHDTGFFPWCKKKKNPTNKQQQKTVFAVSKTSKTKLISRENLFSVLLGEKFSYCLDTQ